jgi:hypothetical protein
MVPIDPAAARYVRSWLGPPAGPGLLALRHALAYRRSGLWGDRPKTPKSVVLVREGDGQLEAFGAGEGESTVAWLLEHQRGFILHAPEPWHEAVRSWFGRADTIKVETWSGAEAAPSRRDLPPAPMVVTRRLTLTDSAAFAATAPVWALRGWGSYAALIQHGVAFGVPHESSFASLAWVFDQVERYDAIGVCTLPRFHRLGLGRAVASSLIDHIVIQRDKLPLWSTTAQNQPSCALAEVLGFSPSATETLLRWPPRLS